MKATSSTRKSNKRHAVLDAWFGPEHQDLYILTRDETRYCMPEVVPFDVACWALSQGEEVFVEDGVISLTINQMRRYAAEHYRYWEPVVQ